MTKCHSCPHVVEDDCANCRSCRLRIARRARQAYQRRRMARVFARRPGRHFARAA